MFHRSYTFFFYNLFNNSESENLFSFEKSNKSKYLKFYLGIRYSEIKYLPNVRSNFVLPMGRA